MLLLITRLFSTILISNVHPFHVSVCEVYHNDKTQSLEISMKIFIDDLELAIQKQGNSNFKLLESEDQESIKNQLGSYLKKKFEIKYNSRKVSLEFLGFEYNNYSVLCYLEGKKIKIINSIEIKNAIITELFDDQINLIHFQYKGEMKSFQATKENPVGIIETSNW